MRVSFLSLTDGGMTGMANARMAELGRHRSVIREIFEYGNRRRAEIGAENVFDFSLGNPSIPAPAEVTATLERLVRETDPVALHGYTSAPGAPAVREKIAATIRQRFGVAADKDDLYLTCGAAASLTIALKALITPGEQVICPAPFFPEYRVFAETAGAEFIIVPCRMGDFQPDVAALERAVTEKTRVLLLNSPNNPTGAVYTEEILRELAAMLEQKQAAYGHPIYILADEPYRELAYDGEVPFIPALYANTLVCYSYSKSFSLPGERIGYIFVPSTAADARGVYAAVCGAGRALGYVCAPSLLQYTVGACAALLPDISVYRQNRDRLYGALTAWGYTVTPPAGAFYLFVKAPEPDAYAFCERARQFELLLVPGDDFGCPGYVRIAYCVAPETIEGALPRFKALAETYENRESAV